jgi:nitrate reductase NapE component
VSKEQLEASLKTFEWLVQVSTVILAIGTVGAAGFGVRTWLLSNRIKKLQHVEGPANTD